MINEEHEVVSQIQMAEAGARQVHSHALFAQPSRLHLYLYLCGTYFTCRRAVTRAVKQGFLIRDWGGTTRCAWGRTLATREWQPPSTQG